MDGWVKIGAEMDTKELEKDIKEAKKKLQSFEKEFGKLEDQKIKIEADIEFAGKKFEKKVKQIEENKQLSIKAIKNPDPYIRQRQKQAIEEKASSRLYFAQQDYNAALDTSEKKLKDIEEQLKENRRVTDLTKENLSQMTRELWADYQPPEFIDEPSFKNQADYVEKKIDELREKIENPAKFNLEPSDVTKLRSEEEKLVNQLAKLEEKQKSFNKELKNAKSITESVNASTTGILKKVAKWGLAIFGIRSAYGMIRNAMSTLTQYDDKLAANLEYIQFALATALKPIIEVIVSLAFKLLNALNYIFKALLGIDLFANASADAFVKAQKSTAKTAKNAKEIKKQLAGFDEMNILEDTSSKSNDSSGIKVPTFDLEKMAEPQFEKIYDWTDKLKEKLQEVGKSYREFGREILEEKGFSEAFITGWEWVVEGVELVLVGLLDVISGILEIIVGIFTADLDKIKEGWDKLVKGIGNILLGLLEIVMGVVALIIAAIIDYLIMPILEWIDYLASKINQAVLDGFNWVIGVLVKFGTWFYDNLIKPVWGFVEWLANAVNQAVFNGFNYIVNLFGKLGQWFYNNVIKPISNYFSNLWTNVKNGASQALDWLKSKFTSIVSFLSSMLSTIVNYAKDIGTKVGDGISSTFKSVVNAVLSAIEKILNTPIKSINKLLDVINAVPGINLKKLPTFDLPRLYTGGIISQPGRGVPIGGQAIGGEAGREGVIPLTNKQAMAELGAEIGKNTVINFTNITKLDNRVISREQKIINNRNEFVLNS